MKMLPLVTSVFLLCGSLYCFSSEPIPRKILALYDSTESPDIYYTKVHTFAEMPLNHLGLFVEYHDLQNGLPEIKGRDDLLGILTWFHKDYVINNPKEYLQWAIEALNSGKKFIVQGNPGFYSKENFPIELAVDFWGKLGLKYTDNWIRDTYDVQLTSVNSNLVGFETPYKFEKPAFYQLLILKDQATPHLTASRVENSDLLSVLVSTSKNGGYVASKYSLLKLFGKQDDYRSWFLNPFEFYKAAFDLKQFPIPDTTTLAGRRIYYSHIDGDGWRSITEIETYRKQPTMSADVIYREILVPYNDLPVSVGPIAADIDTEWMGDDTSREVTKKIFQLPHVEMASHTYTHPFYWHFFNDYQIEDEVPLLDFYPHGSWLEWSFVKYLGKLFRISKDEIEINKECFLVDNHKFSEHCITKHDRLAALGYSIPRAYALKPFNIEFEIEGSIRKINELGSDGKQINLLLWSGDTLPFERAIHLSKELGLLNLNGGDSRFDEKFLSYSWVLPLGRKVGPFHQIYSSNSNENTYTKSWTERFHGFRDLRKTLFNTDIPIRVKPMNLYYHMYSGEKLASLNALKENLNFIQKQKLIPIEASRFAAIVEGFFSASISSIGENIWKVENRGQLQTLRFDKACLLTVDFTHSKGVVGQRHLNGSLYVYLDSTQEAPEVALKETEVYWEESQENLFYLIESRWRVWNVKEREKNQITFSAEGYGVCEMVWKVPEEGLYEISIRGELTKKIRSIGNELGISLDLPKLEPIEITITKT